MKYHYCYKIQFEEVHHIYYGSRSSKCLPELDVKYMGSPQTYKNYWDLCTPIKTILAMGFENRSDAISYERELIIQQWLKDRSLSLNAHLPGENFHRVGDRQAGYVRVFIGISPTGEQVTFVNAKKFVRDNPEWKFSSGCIIACAKGKRPHHKGWRFFYYDDKDNIAPVLPILRIGVEESFVGISPSGEHIKFTNCMKFVRDNPEYNFSFRLISACANGRQESHRGWQFIYHKDYLLMDGKVPPLKDATRTYIGIAPNGDLYEFDNINQFVRDNPNFVLNPSRISSCLVGRNKSHKNWRFFYKESYTTSTEDIKPIKHCGPKRFIGISPEGDLYKFENAAKFCRDNPQWNLNKSRLVQCAKGNEQHHKGWKFSYADESDIA